jgi:tetratricopeptide (TPR) repeat protein
MQQSSAGRRWVTHALLAAVLILPSPVSAQEEPTNDTEARALFEAGRAAYSAGRFDEALDRFRGAYRLSPRPPLLFNIGQSADRLRHDREALEAYEQFLAAEPNSAGAPTARQRIAFLRAQLDRAAAPSDRRDDPSELPAAPDTDVGGESITSRWWFWVAIGAVVVTSVALTIALTSGTEIQDPVRGDVGSGGVVVALQVW